MNWQKGAMNIRKGHPIRTLGDGCEVMGARLTESDVSAMLATLDQWEASVPCWKWREWQFSEDDRVRAHALGVRID